MSFFKFIRNHAGYLTGGVIGIGFVISMLDQTFGLNRKRRLLAAYENQKEVQLDPSTVEITKKLLRTNMLKVEEEAVTEFFVCSGVEPLVRGSLKLMTGVVIGLPQYIVCNSVDELISRCDNLRLPCGKGYKDLPLTALSPELLDTLLLSEKAKTFVVASQLKAADTYYVHIHSLLAGGLSVFAACTCFICNELFLLKPWAKALGIVFVGGLYWAGYVSIWGTYSRWRLRKIDQKVAKMGREYAEGGVEYYQKMADRNKIIEATVMKGREDEGKNEMDMVPAMFRVRDNIDAFERRDYLIQYIKEKYDKVEEKQKEKAADTEETVIEKVGG